MRNITMPFFPLLSRWVQREGIWLLPLLALALMSLVLLRPWPKQVLLEAAEGRWITDAEGTKVKIPSHLQGIAAVFLRSYLPKTHAPQYVLRSGSSNERGLFAGSMASWIYPEFLENDHYWKVPTDLESLLAYDKPGMIYARNIWMGGIRLASDALRGVGLNVVAVTPNAPLPEDPNLTDSEQTMFLEIRVLNAMLNQPEMGELLIDTYLKARARFIAELEPDRIPMKERPRVMGLGASLENWSQIHVASGDEPRLAWKDAATGYLARGRQQEAERVLAINPDILFANPGEVYVDRRWRGLDAVINKRVYVGNGMFGGYIHDIDNLPLSERWQAEIVWPERLKASVRTEIRAYYQKIYGFEMSDERIDELLRVKENANSVGYTRFFRAVPTELHP